MGHVGVLQAVLDASVSRLRRVGSSASNSLFSCGIRFLSTPAFHFQVHFHEVGAIDSIIDTVGVVLALHLLDVEKVYCSALPMSEVSFPCGFRFSSFFSVAP